MSIELDLYQQAKLFDEPVSHQGSSHVSESEASTDHRVAIDHKNKDVHHWFNGSVDEDAFFVWMTKGSDSSITSELRCAIENLLEQSPDALNTLIQMHANDPVSGNRILSIAGTGEYGRLHRNFRAHFAGHDITDSSIDSVATLVSKIREIVDRSLAIAEATS